MSQHSGRVTTALVVGALILASSATLAADLARQSRIGAIFDDRPARGARLIAVAEPRPHGILYTHALKVPGYYGTPRDFEYRNYYGTSPIEIYSRLPYACGFVASC